MFIEPCLNCRYSLDTSNMLMELQFWSSSCIFCRLTTARMSLPIYHLIRAYRFQLV
ncbi:hypothetical protein F383_00829 [Gossypium arboreum]|uniref:Uncharacterized protein n=1 Tax=Gossypium arboreum TaxID=29729 RepID=A0A0B0PMQ4_GOSAR|nr:hypothetical protein F383_00829 [Gossypium arboreum]